MSSNLYMHFSGKGKAIHRGRYGKTDGSDPFYLIVKRSLSLYYQSAKEIKMFEILCADCESGHHSLPGQCACSCCQRPKRQAKPRNYDLAASAATPPPPPVMQVSDWAYADR